MAFSFFESLRRLAAVGSPRPNWGAGNAPPKERRPTRLAHGALPFASQELGSPEICRAEATRLSICSLDDLIFDLVFRLNNLLESNGNSCRFRARLAILYNLAARKVAI
jgi:hypothetical protein